jgi:hypothetical protein
MAQNSVGDGPGNLAAAAGRVGKEGRASRTTS